jgi:hypothetical protein
MESFQIVQLGEIAPFRKSPYLMFPDFETLKHNRTRSWLRHNVTSQKVVGSIPDEVIGLFNWPSPSSRAMALRSTQPRTKMSTRNLPGGKGRPAHKADNLTAICEPIVWKMWEPRCLTTLWTFSACYRDSFTLFIESTAPEMLGCVCHLDICHVTRSAWVKLTDSNSFFLLSCYSLICAVCLRKCYNGEMNCSWNFDRFTHFQHSWIQKKNGFWNVVCLCLYVCAPC